MEPKRQTHIKLTSEVDEKGKELSIYAKVYDDFDEEIQNPELFVWVGENFAGDMGEINGSNTYVQGFGDDFYEEDYGNILVVFPDNRLYDACKLERPLSELYEEATPAPVF